MALTRSKKEERLGSSKYMNCGSLATIIKYQNARNMNVQFEDGTIVEKITWQQWSKGEILNAYVFNLYSASGALISTSNTMYNTNTSLPLSVSYLFSGFEDKTTYSIEVRRIFSSQV